MQYSKNVNIQLFLFVIIQNWFMHKALHLLIFDINVYLFVNKEANEAWNYNVTFLLYSTDITNFSTHIKSFKTMMRMP